MPQAVQTVRAWQHQREPTCRRPHPHPRHRSHHRRPQHISLRRLRWVRVSAGIVAAGDPVRQVHGTAIQTQSHPASGPSSQRRAIAPPQTTHTTSTRRGAPATGLYPTPLHTLCRAPATSNPDETREGMKTDTRNFRVRHCHPAQHVRQHSVARPGIHLLRGSTDPGPELRHDDSVRRMRSLQHFLVFRLTLLDHIHTTIRTLGIKNTAHRCANTACCCAGQRHYPQCFHMQSQSHATAHE